MNPALPKMWHYVYMLNGSTGNYYIGCTSNLEKRLREHREGRVYSTKKMLPIELIYYEAYISKENAFKREKNLKYSGSSLGKLKARLEICKKGRAG